MIGSIHPRNKQDVARRLARWALARDYGLDIACRSPQFDSLQRQDGRLVVQLKHVDGALKPFDTREVLGFAVAGKDRKYHRAQARLVGRNQVEVWSDEVPQPLHVRYGWADNPVCNLRSGSGLPVTPFRSDQWPGVTADAR